MSKTVREIARAMGVSDADIVKEKQRIRDEIKRQNISTQKNGNKFVIDDSDAEKIINVLQARTGEDTSKKDEEKEKLLKKIEELRAANKALKQENIGKDKALNEVTSKKNAEIQRLNSKIEKYADDFKDLNNKQLQLNNQQQQLQARILEQTEQLKETQQKLLTSAEKSSELQDKVDKIENASLWQRITKRFE